MLTQRMQAQIIRDLCEGREPEPGFDPGDLDEPWRSCYQEIIGLSVDERRITLLTTLSNLRSRDAFVTFVLSGKNGGGPLSFPSLEEIATSLPPITWLWEGWIPRGMLSLLGAPPGAGKSYVALDLARRLTAGLPFPDGSAPPSAGDGDTPNVVYVDAEAVPQLINLRASLWHMDRRKLFLMLPEAGHMIDFCERSSRERLVEIVHSARPALVVVDSLSCIHSKGENSVEDVRQVLAFLSALAADASCALLLIHHLRKRSPQAATGLPLSVDDFRGSSHIMAIARTVIGLSVIQTGPQPDRNGPRRLEVVKTNLARHPAPLGLELCPVGSQGVTLRYCLEPPQPYQRPTETDECAAWLVDTLREKGVPTSPKELIRLAARCGYSQSTLYRARRKLAGQIVDTEGRHNSWNKWALPKGTQMDAGRAHR